MKLNAGIMRIEVILLTSKVFYFLEPGSWYLCIPVCIRLHSEYHVDTKKTTFRDILTKIYEKLCTLQMAACFFIASRHSETHFELKNSEFRSEIKFWKSLHFPSEKLRMIMLIIYYAETKIHECLWKINPKRSCV